MARKDKKRWIFHGKLRYCFFSFSFFFFNDGDNSMDSCGPIRPFCVGMLRALLLSFDADIVSRGVDLL